MPWAISFKNQNQHSCIKLVNRLTDRHLEHDTSRIQKATQQSLRVCSCSCSHKLLDDCSERTL